MFIVIECLKSKLIEQHRIIRIFPTTMVELCHCYRRILYTYLTRIAQCARIGMIIAINSALVNEFYTSYFRQVNVTH